MNPIHEHDENFSPQRNATLMGIAILSSSSSRCMPLTWWNMSD